MMKKLICVQTPAPYTLEHISLGEVYESYECLNYYYYIRDDFGSLVSIGMNRFKLLSEIRDEKLNQILT